MRYTKLFGKLTKNDVAIAGGKGASLGEMRSAAIPVPPGFVILADTFDFFIKEINIAQEIRTILNTVDTDDVHTVEKASELIQALILNAKIPTGVTKEIQQEFKKLDCGLVAVRSSATAEDGAEHAWAGQLDSFLNTQKDDLLTNVRKCWASLYTPRAIFYRFEKGLHTTHISVAVVVQKMVKSEKSGIAFSVHPVTQDPNQMIIEAGFGLGEAIVSGAITPDSYVISKKDLPVRGETPHWSAIIDINVNQKSQVLTKKQIIKLAQLVKKIEDHYGTPQDIEWAFQNGKFYIIQSRPITTLATTQTTEQNRNKSFQVFIDDFRATPSVVHSLSYVMENGIKTYVANPPRTFFDFADGNVKWGAEVMHCEEVATSIVNSLTKDPNSYNSFNTSLFKSIDTLKEKAGDIYKSDRVTYSRSDLYKQYTRLMDAYAEVYARGMVPTLADLLVPRLSITVKEHLAPYTDDVDGMFVSLTTPETLSTVAREEMNLLQLTLNKNVTEQSKAVLAHADRYFATFFGYEGPLYTADTVWKRITEMRKDTALAEKRLAKLEEYSKHTKENRQKIEQDLGLPQHVMDILRITREWLASKEARKDSFFSAYAAMDLLMDATSKKTNTMKKLLKFLVRPEMEQFLQNEILPDDLEARLERMVVTSSEDGEVLVLSGEDAAKYIARNVYTPALTEHEEIAGQIAFKGRVTGIVKIVQTIEDIDKMQEGDILVSTATNPNLLPAMRKAAAFVTNVGGITCHAAIISRELGIPCIIGTKIATQVLKDGDLVEVDANEGVVKILKKAGK